MSEQPESPLWRRAPSSWLTWAKTQWRERPRASLLVGGAGLVLLVLALTWLGGGEEAGSEAAVAVVERGPLTIALTETGTIRAKRNVEIKCEVEGQSTITYIVPEGTQVKKGDLLVALDSGDLEDRLIQQKMSYEDAKASYERALADLEITISRNESSIKRAEQDLEFALMDLEKWLGKKAAAEMTGELLLSGSAGAAGASSGSGSASNPAASGAGPASASTASGSRAGGPSAEGGSGAARDAPPVSKELLELAGLELTGHEGELFKERRQALSDIDLAEGQLRQAQARYEATRQLYERNYASQDELVADKLTRDRQRAQLAIAILNKMLQEQYDWPKELKLRQSAVEEARRELQRVKSEAKANLAQAQAELAKRKAQLDLQESRLKKIQEQVAKTKIYAPQDGLVVYPQAPPWRNQPPMEVGAQVRYRQTLIQLPDLSEIIVETKVYESEISKVKVGQKARIKVTALAQAGGNGGKAPILDGEVTKIAVMPDFQNRWLGSEQRTFTVEVTVTDHNPEVLAQLKPEMSAEVTIILARLEDAVHVPVQAVTRLGEQTVCYRLRGGRPEVVPVTVGLASTTRAQILDGLSPGDRVLLYPPLGAAASPAALGLPGTEPEKAAGGEARPAAESTPAAGSSGSASAVSTGSAQANPAGRGEKPPAGLSQLGEAERSALRRRAERATPEERRRMMKALSAGEAKAAQRPRGDASAGSKGE